MTHANFRVYTLFVDQMHPYQPLVIGGKVGRSLEIPLFELHVLFVQLIAFSPASMSKQHCALCVDCFPQFLV